MAVACFNHATYKLLTVSLSWIRHSENSFLLRCIGEKKLFIHHNSKSILQKPTAMQVRQKNLKRKLRKEQHNNFLQFELDWKFESLFEHWINNKLTICNIAQVVFKSILSNAVKIVNYILVYFTKKSIDLNLCSKAID